jgi:RNA polymerase sigma factor (sigma-70 family)
MSDHVSETLQERVDLARKLFSEHGTAIYTMILMQVNDEFLADDLYQELFLSLVKKPLPSNLETPLTYLFRVIANDVIDAMRKRATDMNLQQKYLDRLAIESDDSGSETALQILINREKREKLTEIILRSDLHPCEAKTIIERLNRGSSTKEIARKLSINERSVSHYLSTGLKKLRLLLTSKQASVDDLS